MTFEMEDFTARTDAELLRGSSSPDESFAVFYRRHADALLRYCVGRRLDADTAADVVADTFLVALRQRARYRDDHETARLWLLGIATRRTADIHRRRASERRREGRLRSEALVLSAGDRTSYGAALDADGDPLAALADLPESQRRAIQARVIEERSYADVAAALGLSEAAARQRVSRGLHALRHIVRRTG